MSDLFKAELYRFRFWALAYFAVHGVVMAFFGRVTDLLQQGPMVVQGVAAVYGLSGLLVGLYQMGGYRRANRWLNLIHRPLEPHRIALAIVGAGGILLAACIVLPWLMLLGAQEFLSSRVVDLRHWLVPLSALLLAVAGYLAGCYAILGVRRYAPLVLILPALLGFSNATGAGAVAVQALVASWLLYLVISAFKPDLSQVPARLPAFVATAVPVQLSIFLLVLAVGGIVFQLGWIMFGTHPLNSTPQKGGFVEVTRAEGRQVFADALAGRTDPQARLWRGQVEISDTFKVQPAFDQLPVRGELTNTVPIQFTDKERQVTWTFSHDSMRFEGRRDQDGQKHGQLGLGEEAKEFERPPVTLGDGTLVDARSIANFDDELELILPRLEIRAGETIAAPPQSVGESVALLTDRAVYFYDAAVLQSDDGNFPVRLRIPLVRKIGNLERIDIMELLNGYLVSQTFGRGAAEGKGDPEQFVFELDGSGRVEPVSSRPLKQDFPALSRFQDLWLSPLLGKLYEGFTELFAPRSPLKNYDSSRVPPWVWVLALVLSIVAAASAWVWASRVRLDGSRRLAWVGASAAIGLPALVSLMLFHPRSRDRN